MLTKLARKKLIRTDKTLLFQNYRFKTCVDTYSQFKCKLCSERPIFANDCVFLWICKKRVQNVRTFFCALVLTAISIRSEASCVCARRACTLLTVYMYGRVRLRRCFSLSKTKNDEKKSSNLKCKYAVLISTFSFILYCGNINNDIGFRWRVLFNEIFVYFIRRRYAFMLKCNQMCILSWLECILSQNQRKE